jgi:hypothetical protein
MPMTPFQLAEKARRNAAARKKSGNNYVSTRAAKYKAEYVKPVKKNPSSSSPLFKKKQEEERLRRELNEKIRRELNENANQKRRQEEAERRRAENERRRAENERRTNENKQIQKIYTNALNSLQLIPNGNKGSFTRKNPFNTRRNELLKKLIAAKIHPNKVPLNNKRKTLYELTFKKYGSFLFPNTHQNFRN